MTYRYVYICMYVCIGSNSYIVEEEIGHKIISIVVHAATYQMSNILNLHKQSQNKATQEPHENILRQQSDFLKLIGGYPKPVFPNNYQWPRPFSIPHMLIVLDTI